MRHPEMHTECPAPFCNYTFEGYFDEALKEKRMDHIFSHHGLYCIWKLFQVRFGLGEFRVTK